MEYKFTPKGVCSRSLTFEIEENTLKNVNFQGGCNGNLQGIASLVEGMSIDQVKDKLAGIRCGHKVTSCPDQLAQALSQVLEDRA